MSTSNPALPPSRKIELLSATDLTYLRSVATTAAHSRIDTAFPPDANRARKSSRGGASNNTNNDDDELRARVLTLVDAFLAETYDGVRANCAANGVDVAAEDVDGVDGSGAQAGEAEFEPLDAALAERIRAMEAAKDALTTRVADLRRTGPREAAERWRGKWEAETVPELDVAGTPVKQETGVAAAGDGQGVSELEVGPLLRWEEVQKTYERGVQGLVGLKTGMAETVGRLEEARRVGEELGGDEGVEG